MTAMSVTETAVTEPGEAAVSAPVDAGTDPFATARGRFEELAGFLAGDEAGAASHFDLEGRLRIDGAELLRQLFQDHLDLRALRESRVLNGPVTDAVGVTRGNVEAGHQRTLTTLFGDVVVTRLAYRRPGHTNLYPADGVLNLPPGRHSHGLRLLAAVESTRGSFDDAVAGVDRATATKVPKRQLENLAAATVADFDTFYKDSLWPPDDPDDVIVLSVDGKGIVMRPESLRPGTAAAAAAATPKLATRLSKGEKRGRKRMAEVGAVYEIKPVPRTTADVLATSDHTPAAPAPKAKHKWVTASPPGP